MGRARSLPSADGTHSAPAAVTGCPGRLQLRERRRAGKASRGGRGLRCPGSLGSARFGPQPPPSPGRVRLRQRRARPAGLRRGGTSGSKPSGPARRSVSERASWGDRRRPGQGLGPRGLLGRPSPLPLVGPGVTEQPPARRSVPTRDGERPRGRGAEAGFGGCLQAGASPGSAPCGCRRRQGQSRPAALPPRRGWDIKAGSE